MPDAPHPPWCVSAFCTINRLPVNGHQFGAHRSRPQVVEATVLRLQQSPTAPTPLLELRRGDAVLAVPLTEARALPEAIDDLLEAAGVGP